MRRCSPPAMAYPRHTPPGCRSLCMASFGSSACSPSAVTARPHSLLCLAPSVARHTSCCASCPPACVVRVPWPVLAAPPVVVSLSLPLGQRPPLHAPHKHPLQ